MRLINLVCIIVLLNIKANCQYEIFEGKLGQSSIQLTLCMSSDGYCDPSCVYMYDRYRTPIELVSILKGDTMLFFENYDWYKGAFSAVISIPNWNDNRNNVILNGSWKDYKTKSLLKVTLNKKYEFNKNEENEIISNKELLQIASTKEDYFKIVISKKERDNSPHVNAIRVYDKKTGNCKQEIKYKGEIESRLFDDISVNSDSSFLFGRFDYNGGHRYGKVYKKGSSNGIYIYIRDFKE